MLEKQDEAASENYSYPRTTKICSGYQNLGKLDQGLNAEKATTELCPPKPNEFEIAEYDNRFTSVNPDTQLKKFIRYTRRTDYPFSVFLGHG